MDTICRRLNQWRSGLPGAFCADSGNLRTRPGSEKGPQHGRVDREQKMATTNGGYPAIGFGKTSDKVYSQLTSDHPIDLARTGLIDSGGESKGDGDLAQAVRTAVINKRAGGIGLIAGHKAFQRPRGEGAQLLNAIQDVYLSPSVTIA
jgi:class I fructose-bisphosphate aldolase